MAGQKKKLPGIFYQKSPRRTLKKTLGDKDKTKVVPEVPELKSTTKTKNQEHEAAATKLQAFLRGAMCRHRVGLIVANLIEELLKRKQERYQQKLRQEQTLKELKLKKKQQLPLPPPPPPPPLNHLAVSPIRSPTKKKMKLPNIFYNTTTPKPNFRKKKLTATKTEEDNAVTNVVMKNDDEPGRDQTTMSSICRKMKKEKEVAPIDVAPSSPSFPSVSPASSNKEDTVASFPVRSPTFTQLKKKTPTKSYSLPTRRQSKKKNGSVNAGDDIDVRKLVLVEEEKKKEQTDHLGNSMKQLTEDEEAPIVPSPCIPEKPTKQQETASADISSCPVRSSTKNQLKKKALSVSSCPALLPSTQRKKEASSASSSSSACSPVASPTARPTKDESSVVTTSVRSPTKKPKKKRKQQESPRKASSLPGAISSPTKQPNKKKEGVSSIIASCPPLCSPTSVTKELWLSIAAAEDVIKNLEDDDSVQEKDDDEDNAGYKLTQTPPLLSPPPLPRQASSRKTKSSKVRGVRFQEELNVEIPNFSQDSGRRGGDFWYTKQDIAQFRRDNYMMNQVLMAVEKKLLESEEYQGMDPTTLVGMTEEISLWEPGSIADFLESGKIPRGATLCCV